MVAADLLNDLRTSGFTLRVRGDSLHVAPAERLTDDLRAAIRANKPELLALLARPAEGDWVHLLGPDGTTHNLLEPWRIDAIVESENGLIAIFIGRPYGSWPLMYCQKIDQR